MSYMCREEKRQMKDTVSSAALSTSSQLCSSNHLLALILLALVLSHAPLSSSQLAFGFYAASCPGAGFLVRNAVRSASLNDPTVPGKLLRLLFHDCFVEGCDASVLIQGNGTERSDPANLSLGGFQVIDSAKEVLETFCPGTVSCADIVALAARDAVEFTGGPRVEIPTGRRDGTVSLAAKVRPNIVDTSFTLDQMITSFSSKGLSLEDIVVLSGAHTIGSAHCNSFNNRFKQDSRGNHLIDGSLDTGYANSLIRKCAASNSSAVSSSVTVDNDPETSFQFDNQYYKNLLMHKGLFQTDSVLLSDDRPKNLVAVLAQDQESFFRMWGDSFVRLSIVGAKTGEEGEVRRSCSSVNV